jgi:hypothetical protein
MSNSGVVNIRGKEYQTVALRIANFRKMNPLWSIQTQIIERTEQVVVMCAEIYTDDNKLIATGHAEENRKASQINQTSALENCETSAIGRALAAAGFGGTEFASADEVANAVHQQSKKELVDPDRMKSLEVVFRAVPNHEALQSLWKNLTREEKVACNELKEEAKARLK